ncbi:lysine-specific histone demethylase 1 homolog 1-like [Dioscorea cayenensis subsp. rotundata]|uniref:Lysine-specific histone demethylase 1 homolog 1-like n=1 Tax=Dioscorea cayennensis subsp. rotundata TaxID=55577 RepID=A0AB40AGJ4_DIOCR|nr:lysine-specific histone demethylase 1 homolog 1-like [Dioscorea cayenensis subsp. rotundata]
MEIEDASQSTPPPDPSHSTPPSDPSQSTPPAENLESPPARKRRRRRKQFPEMVPSLSVRSLRPQSTSRSGTAPLYNDALIDELLQLQPRPPRRRSNAGFDGSLSDLDVEALVALSVGFASDSLSEDEILSSVVPTLSGPIQSNYIIVRNHILSRWRSTVSSRLSESHAMESIRSEHKNLVSSAFSFLSSHGFINFGLAPAFRLPAVPFPPRANVVVIGAGIAGLAAARQLITFGFKVAILEARSRPGGRVHTRKMCSDDGSIVAAADLGGSVLTGINGNPLGVLARQLGFPLHKVRDVCPLYLPDGRPVDTATDSRVETAFNQLLDKACKLRESILEEFQSVDVSLGTALEAFRKAHGVAETPEERMLLNWHLANLEYANAALLSDLSMAYWDQDDPYEMGGDHCFIPGGNCRFVRALAEDIPIFYNQTVSRIHYGCDGVLVYTNDQAFHADMALCTVPLGVLKKGSIVFDPELPPPKQDAIKRLGFGLLNKVAMLFPHDFWGGGIDTFGHLTEDPRQRGEFFLFYSYTSVSGGPLLVALVAGESAIKFENSSPVEAVERVLGVLRGIFTPKGIEVPAPIQVVCTRWGSDKFTYGSYSYVAIGSSGDDYDVLAEPVGDRVFFAGEATNRKYPATMHGALLSGFREAANISRAAKRSSILSTTDRVDCREEQLDLDDLYHNPDLSFGSFSVLYDPCSSGSDSISLLRVGIGERKTGSGLLYLYALISKRHVMELHDIDGDERRLSLLYRNFGTKLVGRDGLGSLGDSLLGRIKAARLTTPNTGIMKGSCQI